MKAKVILAVAAIVLMFGPATAMGDYVDNFDQYNTAWTSFGPWTTANTMGTCFTGSGLSNPSPNTAGKFGSTFTSPTIFLFDGTSVAGCFPSSQSYTLTAATNATSTAVTVSFYFSVFTSAGANATVWTFSLDVCGVLVGTAPVGHTTQYWTQFTYTGSIAAGTGSCPVQFILATVAGAGAHAVSVAIDNIVIKNSNACLQPGGTACPTVSPKPDIFLQSLSTSPFVTNPWYNITAFSNSRIVVNYTSGASFIIANVTAPDVIAPLVNAILITVYVGAHCVGTAPNQICTTPFSDSVIPTSTTHQIIYLPNPLNPTTPNVFQFEIQVADFSGNFPGARTGTTLITGTSTSATVTVMTDTNLALTTNQYAGQYLEYISGPCSGVIRFISANGATTITTNTFASTCTPTGGGGDTWKVISLSLGSHVTIRQGSAVIASGYLDSNNQFSLGAIPGQYQIQITNGANVFLSTQTFVIQDILVTVTIPSVQINYPQNEQTAISCLGFWSSATTITANYNDSTITTTSVTIVLLQLNASGTFTIQTNTFSAGPYGTVTEGITNATASPSHIWLKYSGQYSVRCTSTNTFGTGIAYPGPNGQPVAGGQAGPTGPAFPDFLNLATIFPTLSSPDKQITGITVLTAVAAGFSEFFGPIGFLIVSVITGYLGFAGFLLIPATFAAVMAFVAVIYILIWNERRNR